MPTVIRTKTVRNNGTLTQALNSYGMVPSDHESLALLNGMELSDQVKAGSLIKVFGQLSN